MPYKIEADVEIPLKRVNLLKKYPLKDMKPKDSFKFPIGEYHSVTQATQVIANLNPSWKFSIKKVDSKTAYRIWRLF